MTDVMLPHFPKSPPGIIATECWKCHKIMSAIRNDQTQQTIAECVGDHKWALREYGTSPTNAWCRC